MEDLKSLLIGILGTLLVMGGIAFYKKARCRALRSDIELLELELESLEKMKRSSVEMNRASFKGIFALLFLLGLANVIPIALNWIELSFLSEIRLLLETAIWLAFVCIAYIWWKRYDNLKNYSEAVKVIEKRKLKKEGILEKLSK